MQTCKKCNNPFITSRDSNLCEKCEKQQFVKGLKELKEKKSLSEMELIEGIHRLNAIKNDHWDFTKEQRLEAEDKSFELFEKLLRLCDGDHMLMNTLLGNKDWFRKRYVKGKED